MNNYGNYYDISQSETDWVFVTLINETMITYEIIVWLEHNVSDKWTLKESNCIGFNNKSEATLFCITFGIY